MPVAAWPSCSQPGRSAHGPTWPRGAGAEGLAAQRPFWRPGTATGYHALVMGALSGEVVRRATGQTVQSLFGTLLRDRLQLDLHFGLPADQDHRFLPA